MLKVTRFTVPCFRSAMFDGKIGMGLVADVDTVGGQRKLSVEIQVADAVDLDAPDDGFGEAGVLNLSDVVGRVLVKRAAAKDSGESGLSRCCFPENANAANQEEKSTTARMTENWREGNRGGTSLNASHDLLVETGCEHLSGAVFCAAILPANGVRCWDDAALGLAVFRAGGGIPADIVRYERLIYEC